MFAYFALVRYHLALLTDMKLVSLTVTVSLFLFVFGPPLSIASDVGKQPPNSNDRAEFSADDFDWRDIVPSLFAAASLPSEQGLESVLENSKVLRTYVANEVRAECKPDKSPCAKSGGLMLEEEVNKRIDEIVREGTLHRHNTATVDYRLARQPFPFSEISAVKSDKRQDAYFMLALSGRNYTATQVEAKYGAPYDTDIFQWYSVFKYRLESPRYTSKAVFEIDPADGAVIKVAISLKPKKPKNR